VLYRQHQGVVELLSAAVAHIKFNIQDTITNYQFRKVDESTSNNDDNVLPFALPCHCATVFLPYPKNETM
jgi:hypothetical protein